MAEIKYVSLSNLESYDGKIKEYITSADNTLRTNLEGQVEVVAGALDGEIARAKAAEEAAQAAADKAQGDVDALETLVGTLPEGATAATVVGYIDEKTANIASDATVNALAGRVTQAEADIDAIEADYLKAADKEELNGLIEAAQAAADKAQEEVDALEQSHSTDKAALEAKDAELLAAINTEKERAEGVEESLQTQINTIMNNPDAEGAINSINEFTQYVADHGTIADGFRSDIDKNKEDIAAIDTAYKAADTALSGRLDTLEAIDHEAYVAADTALENKLNGEIAKKADASALTSAVEALEGADAGQVERIEALEAKFTGEGSVASQITAAKQEAIDAAASAADTKDEAVLAAAKRYADDEDAKIESRVDALETASGTHALASDLTTLAGRVTTAEGEIDTLQSEMDAVEALAAANKAAHEANAAAIALKASQADLDALELRVDAVEAWQTNMVECTEDDIVNLFA